MVHDRRIGVLDLAAFVHRIGLADAEQASQAKTKQENQQGRASGDRRSDQRPDLPDHRSITLPEPPGDVHPIISNRPAFMFASLSSAASCWHCFRTWESG